MYKMRACNFCLCTHRSASGGLGRPGCAVGGEREKFRWPPDATGSALDRTLTSFASGILSPSLLPPASLPLPRRGAAFSRSIAKLSKLSNRGQRAYNAKVRNRGEARMRGRTCIARAIQAEVLRPYNIPRTSCHFATAFQWLMSAFESTLGTVRYTLCYTRGPSVKGSWYTCISTHTQSREGNGVVSPVARTYHPFARGATRSGGGREMMMRGEGTKRTASCLPLWISVQFLWDEVNFKTRGEGIKEGGDSFFFFFWKVAQIGCRTRGEKVF